MYDRESLKLYIERVYREPVAHTLNDTCAEVFSEAQAMPCYGAPMEPPKLSGGAAPIPRPDEAFAAEEKAEKAEQKESKRRAPLFGMRKGVLSSFRVERKEEADANEAPPASFDACASAPLPPDAVGSVPGASYSYSMPAPKYEVDESFRDALFRLIDEKGLRDPDVYKRAEIDRRHFAKIRNDYENTYRPSKKTAIRLALSLGLSLDETNTFIGRAGYRLSRSILSDVIVMYFLENGVYDLTTINEALYEEDQQTLTE